MKLEIINRRKARKYTNLWKLQDTLKKPMGQRRNYKGNYKIETSGSENNISKFMDSMKAIPISSYI